MEHDVFLSYTSSDKKHMGRIRDTLEAAGLKVWIDDTGLGPGTENWLLVIEEAIKESSCIVCIITPNTPGSRWVRKELAYADYHGKTVHPVHVAGAMRDVITLHLATSHMLDVRESHLYQPRMEHLIRIIKRNHLKDEQLVRTNPLKLSTLKEVEKDDLIYKISKMEIPENERHLLIVTQGELDVPRTKVRLNRPVFTIGRNDLNTFVVSDLRVSNKHCQFVYTRTGYFLVDLASTNGTYINEELTFGQLVRDRDEIRVGRIHLLYRRFDS